MVNSYTYLVPKITDRRNIVNAFKNVNKKMKSKSQLDNKVHFCTHATTLILNERDVDYYLEK